MQSSAIQFLWCLRFILRPGKAGRGVMLSRRLQTPSWHMSCLLSKDCASRTDRRPRWCRKSLNFVTLALTAQGHCPQTVFGFSPSRHFEVQALVATQVVKHWSRFTPSRELEDEASITAWSVRSTVTISGDPGLGATMPAFDKMLRA